jgi:hypothetical protein
LFIARTKWNVSYKNKDKIYAGYAGRFKEIVANDRSRMGKLGFDFPD